MQLDVIIPTYNRSGLLRQTIASLFRAPIPPGLSVNVTVVDNNSTDDTATVVQALREQWGSRLHYVSETVQGRGAALNRGIVSTRGDLVGMVDDDEEIDEHWYQVIESRFRTHPELGFLGGPYLPATHIRFPSWLPMPRYRGVIGWMESGPEERFFTAESNILLGGNAVIKRTVFDQVGLYDARLGRSKGRLMSMEDQDMYERFLHAGVVGLYTPALIVFHHIPPSRLTRSYHRRWCFWTGVSIGLRERSQPSRVVHVLGMPRHRIRKAGVSLLGALRGLSGRIARPETFANELDLWMFAGMLVGLYFWREQQAS